MEAMRIMCWRREAEMVGTLISSIELTKHRQTRTSMDSDGGTGERVRL